MPDAIERVCGVRITRFALATDLRADSGWWMKWGDANYGLEKRARDGGYWGVADNLLVLPTRFAVTAVHVESLTH